jgi:hypothetical protein
VASGASPQCGQLAVIRSSVADGLLMLAVMAGSWNGGAAALGIIVGGVVALEAIWAVR